MKYVKSINLLKKPSIGNQLKSNKSVNRTATKCTAKVLLIYL